MLRTVLIAVFGLLLMGLSAGNGLDRIARVSPQVAAQVPGLFANQAFRTLGEQALAAKRPADAAAFGWHAINRAPTDPVAVALLGAGKLGQGDLATADRVFRVAGQMGWRVPLTQAYWFDRAMGSGDYDVAMLRLDALLRQQPNLLDQQLLLDRVERDPQARAALVEQLSQEPIWLDRYVGEVYSLPPEVLTQRATVMVEAARDGTVLGCDRIGPLAWAMTTKALYPQARELWQGHCPEAGNELVDDPGFARLNLQGNRSPFDWNVIGNGEVLLGLVNGGKGQGKRLTIDGTPSISRQFMSKLVLAPPGRYQLSWKAANSNGRPTDRIRLSLTCKGADEAWLEPVLDPASGRWTAVVSVPANCPAQVLGFALAAGGGSLSLEAVRLDPLS